MFTKRNFGIALFVVGVIVGVIATGQASFALSDTEKKHDKSGSFLWYGFGGLFMMLLGWQFYSDSKNTTTASTPQ